MTFGQFDESFVSVPIIKNEKVVSVMQGIRNKKTNKVFFSHTEDTESISFFQNIIFSKRLLKPLKDTAYPSNNSTSRAYWQPVTSCSTRTLIVGCTQDASGANCTPIVSSTTTCTTTYIFTNDYDDSDDGYYPPDGYTYDGTRPNVTDDEDPCAKAKAGSTRATTTSKSTAFNTAKTTITGMKNGKENGVVFGNVNYETKSTSVQTGGTSSGTLTHTFSDPIADLHNHPGNNPPSTGDLYVLISNQQQFTNYSTRYVVTLNGTTYALVVTDKTAMNIFLKNYPPSITSNPYGGNFVNFPQPLFNEWDDISFYNNDNQEMALSVILDKYNSGIMLTKMDNNGNFKKVNYISNTDTAGTTTYTNTPCPN
ncbi:hypothetical protein FNJ88_12075 [Chryseobacterium sp. SNU WT5]|uniref:hypothetical protein n=1 Tax=Chryseobacterium sp. SNU WT5 TaxID=2594269 RepID=UPI00117DB830|nr:hypothetical protein [Chryseobacterium sp. SNU WT5]QDP86249.1 hypothetical protein FNJ88_12075 [Chryseobacterium sp. SNU WT5]